MTNPEEETRKNVAEREVTTVQGQPTNQDLDFLEEAILRIASFVGLLRIGGGAHGHVGLLLSDVDYTAIAPGVQFIVPANPGVLF